MTLEQLFPRIIPALERARVPYMLTGSVASSLHGSPRSTRDLDVVINPSREQLLHLVRDVSDLGFFADEQQALDALAHRSQFNVIDNTTGWKVDLIFQEDSAYGRLALARSVATKIAGMDVEVATPEDVLIAKLRWAKMSGSGRQLQDVTDIVRAQGQKLDLNYVEHWVRELDLQKQWNQV